MIYAGSYHKIEEKEGPKAPLFLYQDVALAVALVIYAGGGFGQRFLSDAAFVIAILILIIGARGWIFTGLFLILGIFIYQPAFIQASPIVGALLVSTNRPKHAIIVLATSGAQLVGHFNPFYLPAILLPVALIFVSNRWRPSNKLLGSVATILLLLNIAPTIFPQSAPTGHQSFDFPYRIDIAKRMGNAVLGNTYTSIDDHGNTDMASILVLEHDPPHGLATHNWSQKRLWTENYYYGAPLYRIAVGLDGFLFSNLGCKISESNLRLLGEAHQTEHNSFISYSHGKTVYSDSDFLNNGAVGYQKHLNAALFERISLPNGILILSSLLLLLSLTQIGKSVVLPLLIVLMIASSLFLHSQTIDIRIKDRREIWPHSKGVSGIGAEITEATGIKTVSKVGNAKILAIARENSAHHKTERVVVMEGGSTVKIGENTFEALDLPMGESEGILNAIPVRKVGSTDAGKCVVSVGGITIIGTNSGRSNWKRIYAAAE